MNLSLIILGLALLAVFSVFGIRFYEFHTGKLFMCREKRHKIEEKVTDFYKHRIDWILKFSNQTKIFFKNLPTLTAHISHFYWRKFSKKVDQFFLRIRHKK
jgi:hypothetical protein